VGIDPGVELFQYKQQRVVRHPRSRETEKHPATHLCDSRSPPLVVPRMIFPQQIRQLIVPVRIGYECVHQLGKLLVRGRSSKKGRRTCGLCIKSHEGHLLCATSVFSVSLWLVNSKQKHTTETQRTQRLHREINMYGLFVQSRLTIQNHQEKQQRQVEYGRQQQATRLLS